MEFNSNKFIHRSVSFCNYFVASRFGKIFITQIQHFQSSDFLSCSKPSRFTVEHVFFHFEDSEDSLFYYKVSYKDSLVQFRLYFHNFTFLHSFFFHYNDDYDLHKSLSILYNGQNYFCTFNDCLAILYSRTSGESSNVQPFDYYDGRFDDGLSF